jgi:DNA modification methylase
MDASQRLAALPLRSRDAPQLVWPGKTAPQVPTGASLATHEVVAAEREAPAAQGWGWRNRLIWGDNLRAMAAILPEYTGQVQLIYVDPPFDTGTAYVQRVAVGDQAGRQPPRIVRHTAYRDTWGPGRAGYLQMLYERLSLMYLLLADGGAIYVHVDPTVGHYVRLILDELFGPTGFQREIIWRIGWVSGYKSAVANWVRNHDTILYYTKGRPAVFNKEYLSYPAGYRRRGSGASPGRGYPIEDVWNASAAEQALMGPLSLDSIQIKRFCTEKTGFPTQKNESLLRRIVQASSNPGDLVGDFFCGSGTTLAVAEQLGRRWIGCDMGWRAIHTTRKRLLDGVASRAFLLERCTEPSGSAREPGAPPAAQRGAARAQVAVEESGRTVAVSLRGYRPGPQHEPAPSATGTSWPGYLDYWAVDFDYDGAVFRDAWRTFHRPRQAGLLLTSAQHTYERGGSYSVAVKVVDVVGSESITVVDVVVD